MLLLWFVIVILCGVVNIELSVVCLLCLTLTAILIFVELSVSNYFDVEQQNISCFLININNIISWSLLSVQYACMLSITNIKLFSFNNVDNFMLSGSTSNVYLFYNLW